MHVTIIGFGRVGLPLGLFLESKGCKVSAVDVDDKIIHSFNNRNMPFYEPGCDELLETSNIQLGTKIPDSDAYIITVGTPYRSHIEINFNYLKKVLTDFLNVDFKGKLIILRSTIAPGTTQQVLNFIEANTKWINGRDFYLAMCPERIAEGFALKELTELPQIIGVEDDVSFEKASEVFKYLEVELLRCKFIEAELSKLLTNIYRYIDLAIPNYFMCVADHYNIDGHNLLNLMKRKYPRNNGLKKPGLTGGSCVPGNRKIKIYYEQDNKHFEEYITYENLSKNFIDYRIDSFDENLKQTEKKQVLKCNNRKYSGKMYRFIFADDSFFECTEDHLIPVIHWPSFVKKLNNYIVIKEAKDIKKEDTVLRFL